MGPRKYQYPSQFKGAKEVNVPVIMPNFGNAYTYVFLSETVTMSEASEFSLLLPLSSASALLP